MKSLGLFLLATVFCLYAEAQNRKPRIVGQDPLAMNEDESITILMSYLDVEDADDWFYPWGFTMTLYAGSDYTISGNVVTPATDFSGKLRVPVTVNDGDDDSNKYDLEITVNPVNDRPVITGHASLSTNENQSLSIELSHLTVKDPDNKYPNDFVLRVYDGSNYTVTGTTVTPQTGFSGMLSVNVTVNDGQLESDMYGLPVQVKPVDRVPRITGQSNLETPEEQPITILLTHLTVVDEDSNYPEGFTLSVAPGANYTVANTTVTPDENFAGKLSVPVTVNDGRNTSQPFNLTINVTPVNDVPTVTSLETTPLFYGTSNMRAAISQTLEVHDADNDSIMFAEVGFRPDGYTPNADKLVFEPPANSKVRGVFDPNTRILTLLGQASPQTYSVALRSVFFETIAPSEQAKTIYIVVNDSKSSSQPVERTILPGSAGASLDIPSGFTPNGDNVNDTWKIIPLNAEEDYAQAHIRVYNKEGIIVHESVGLEREWDGRYNGELLPADTYFYSIDLQTNTADGYVRGLVTILR